MGRKCSVHGCKSGYPTETKKSGYKKIPIYKFPKNKEERKRWLDNISNAINSEVTIYMGICALHWPEDVKLIRHSGRYHVPSEPPSIFPNIDESHVPRVTPSRPRRQAKPKIDAGHHNQSTTARTTVKWKTKKSAPAHRNNQSTTNRSTATAVPIIRSFTSILSPSTTICRKSYSMTEDNSQDITVRPTTKTESITAHCDGRHSHSRAPSPAENCTSEDSRQSTLSPVTKTVCSNGFYHHVITPNITSDTSLGCTSPDIGQMVKMEETDCFKTDSFVSTLSSKLSQHGFVSMDTPDSPTKIILLSSTRDGPVHTYSLYLSVLERDEDRIQKLRYEAYKSVKYLSHLTYEGTLARWSQLDFLLQFITTPAEDETENRIMELPCTQNKAQEYPCLSSLLNLQAYQNLQTHVKMEAPESDDSN